MSALPTLATELPQPERYCTACNKPLSGRVVWLEADSVSGEYRQPGLVPAERSQGCFPFGATCARSLSA